MCSFKPPGWRLLFLTSWGRFQRRFENIFEDLERHGDLIDRAANAKNIAEARELRQEISTWKEKNLAQIKQSEEDHAGMQYREVLSWLKIDTGEQFSIFQSTLEESSKFPGTCAWMTKNERISCWLQRKSTGSLLWLQGNPGSGKSVLSTQLINFLRKSKSFVMNHSCSQTFASSTKYEAVLKSFLHQLLHKSSDLLAYLYKELVIGKKIPTISDLEHLIELLLDGLSEAGRIQYVWVVVDGIEECEATKHTRLTSLLGRIAKPSMRDKTICKVLVTSRIHPIKFKRIWQKQTVSLSDETNHLYNAIKLYSSQRLRLLHERFQQLELDSDDVEQIEETIAKKADGAPNQSGLKPLLISLRHVSLRSLDS
jgi:archaellum biogenesis ATPase FlaH